jgi:hypothetical protein
MTYINGDHFLYNNESISKKASYIMTEDEKAEIELQVRRLLADEVNKYREFLEKQFRLTMWVIGIVLTVAVAAFLYYFGKSKDDLRTDLVREIDQKVVEYRIDKNLRDRLEELAKVVADSPTVHDLINASIRSTADKTVPPKVEEFVTASLSEKLKEISSENLQQLIKRATDQTLGDMNARIYDLDAQLKPKTGKLTLETTEVVFHEPLGTNSAILNTKTPGRIVGAWYCPIDNLGDFGGMHAIRVTVVDDSHVKLDWDQTRNLFLRVQVFMLIAGA